MDLLSSLLARQGFLPHGYCFQWSPPLLWSMVGADVAIALAYFSLPLVILRYGQRRPEVNLGGLATLFGTFIFACGVTHAFGVWTIWRPDYSLQTAAKVITAVVSVFTAVAAWKLLPRALAIPSTRDLSEANAALRVEIDRRLSVEDLLHGVEQSLSATLATIDAALIATDENGRVTRINAVAERVTGWPAAEALGQRYWDVFDRLGRSPALKASNPVQWMIDRGPAAEAPRSVVCVSRDGRHTPVEVNAALARRSDGSVRGMTMIFRDASRLASAEAAVRRSEARLRFALESAGIGDFEMDGAGGELQRSLRFDSCLGLAPSTLRWTRQDLLAAVHPEDRAMVDAAITRALTGSAPWHSEFRVIWPDGSEHWLRVDARSLERNGLGESLVGIVAETTEIHRAEEARRQAQLLEAENRRVHESSRLKSQFLANMSHELRTPLNAVIGFADLLRVGIVPPGSERSGQYLGHISTSGRHLLQLINDVLDLSKIEAGKLELRPEDVHLPQLVDEVVATLSEQARARDLQLTSELAPELQALRLDPGRLKQVLFNYLSNAIKFTEPGGRVTVRAYGEGPELWRLEVEDNGVGIGPEDQARLFIEFQQLDAGFAKRHQGTGLGLALSRQLVEAQGGRVGVYSQTGLGSVFYAVLPRVAASGEADADGGAPRLLVAAHHHPTRDRLARDLARGGVSVDAAGSSGEVVRLAHVRRYSGLSLDLALPDGPALAALADMRSHPGTRGTAVKALSVTLANRGSVAYAITDLIAKPLQQEELERSLVPLRERFSEEHPMLVVDDDPQARELMCGMLEAIGIASVAAPGGAEALVLLGRVVPAAMVLDLMMPEVDGFKVLHALRRDPVWRALPVFVWTAMTLEPGEVAELSRTAQALLDKGEAGGLDAVLDALLEWAHSSPPAAAGDRSEG